MENEWARAKSDGKTVMVKIEPIYVGDEMRPDKFVVQYKIGDEKLPKIKTFTNASAGKK